MSLLSQRKQNEEELRRVQTRRADFPSRLVGLSRSDEEDSDDDELEDEEGDGGEDVDKVGMVPMADMLNARWGEENVSRPFRPNLFFQES